MSEWREDNFLEKLTHGSSQANGRACPHIEEFCAVATSSTASPPSAEFLDHLDQCPVCSELLNRVALFDQPNGLEVNSASPEMEQRLDCWLKGFLAAQTLRPQVPEVVATPKVIALPLVQKARPIWRMQWALAAAAMIVLAVGAIYIRRTVNPPTTTPVVAQATQPPRTPPDSRSLPEPSTREIPTTQSRAQKPSQKRQSASVTSRILESPPAAPSEPWRPPEQAPQVVAQATPGDQSALVKNEKSSPASSPTLPAAPVALSPKMQAPARAMNVPSRATGTAGAARPSGPLRVQLPAGTRIWLSLDSVMPEAEGSFQFHATLLLPVTDSGITLVEKGAQATGSGQTIAKQTVIQITKIVSRGRLLGLNSALTGVLKGPGTGNALHFEEGKVFEVFLDSASTFEATEVPGGNPHR